MSVTYQWSDDLQWFCILVDDGVNQYTASLSRDEAADLSAEADPQFADMLGKGREFALKALADARQAALTAPSQPASAADVKPHEAPDWLWYGEVDGKPVVTFGRWPKHGAQWRYKWAEIQATEHDHPKRLPFTRKAFETMLAALNYDGPDIDSLTVAEIRRALP